MGKAAGAKRSAEVDKVRSGASRRATIWARRQVPRGVQKWTKFEVEHRAGLQYGQGGRCQEECRSGQSSKWSIAQGYNMGKAAGAKRSAEVDKVRSGASR